MAQLDQSVKQTSSIKIDHGDEIRVVVARKEHREGLIRLIRDEYLPREPIEAAMGTTWEEAEESLTCEIDDALSQRCSFVAVHPQSGVIGFRTSKLIRIDPDRIPDPNDLLIVEGDAPTLRAFQQIITQLMGGWEREFIQRGFQLALQFISLCVDHRFANRGIAKRMVEESTRLAERIRVDCIFAIATNRISQRVLQKGGFAVWRSLEYEDAKNPETGQPWVVPNHGNTCIQWMVKVMGRKGMSG